MEHPMTEIQPSLAAEARTKTVARGINVLRTEADALEKLALGIDDSFADACELILGARGRVIITGMGKSGHIGRKAAATFSATGTPAAYVHPAEAAHGDLGMLIAGDILMVISNSGNTAELHAILKYTQIIGVKVIGIASRRDSLVMRHADVEVAIPLAREACASNIAPTTSTTMQLALCDALAMAVMDLRGFSSDGMKTLHPGGAIGLRLLPVKEVMHRGGELPLVRTNTPMAEVVSMMTSLGFGIAGVVDDAGGLVGVITDGDLRRHFANLADLTAGEVMTATPKTLDGNMSAEAALELMNDLRITAAFIVDGEGSGARVPSGVNHIHDFLRIGLS